MEEGSNSSPATVFQEAVAEEDEVETEMNKGVVVIADEKVAEEAGEGVTRRWQHWQRRL